MKKLFLSTWYFVNLTMAFNAWYFTLSETIHSKIIMYIMCGILSLINYSNLKKKKNPKLSWNFLKFVNEGALGLLITHFSDGLQTCKLWQIFFFESRRDRIKGLKLWRLGKLNFTYHGKLLDCSGLSTAAIAAIYSCRSGWSVEAHHRFNGPDTGRNSRGRRIKKWGKYMVYIGNVRIH